MPTSYFCPSLSWEKSLNICIIASQNLIFGRPLRNSGSFLPWEGKHAMPVFQVEVIGCPGSWYQETFCPTTFHVRFVYLWDLYCWQYLNAGGELLPENIRSTLWEGKHFSLVFLVQGAVFQLEKGKTRQGKGRRAMKVIGEESKARQRQEKKSRKIKVKCDWLWQSKKVEW